MKTLAIAATLALLPLTALAEGETHRIAVHVDSNDPQVINMALNNVQNLTAYYEGQGDEVVVEVVAYGPGLHMFRTDTSPVADRIEAMSMSMDSLSFSACGNTLRAMSERAGADVELMEGVGVVPSGVVRLVELQEDGYAYIRP